MIDHISIGVSSLKKAKDFYDAALKPLGYACVFTVDIPGEGIVAHGYGEGREAELLDRQAGESSTRKPTRKAALMSRSSPRAARRSTRSTRPRSRPAPRTMARRACGRITTPITTAHSRMTRTATRSKLAAIIRNRDMNRTLEHPKERTNVSLKIRLTRGGAKKRPYYRIVVAESRFARDGRFVEHIGAYNPMLGKEDPKRVTFDVERAKHWLKMGATPSDRVAYFFPRTACATRRCATTRPSRTSRRPRRRSARRPRPTRPPRRRRSSGVTLAQ